MQFHVLSFEGPDLYSRSGGLATRVEGLSETLAMLGFETHLWFVGAPDLPGHERRGGLHLHRWCQWISRSCPDGVYDGEHEKVEDYAASVPPYLIEKFLLPHLRSGEPAVVLAEEWQTVDAVLQLHRLLCNAGLEDRVRILWNANNTFGFGEIDWQALSRAAVITTVSRYMKHRMREWGVDALVIPNGLAPEAYTRPKRSPVQQLRNRHHDRTVLTKMARWDPDKRWIESIRIVAEMKRQGWKPLLVARGGNEAHGQEVLREAHRLGLSIVDRAASRQGNRALLDVLLDVNGADVVNLSSHVDPDARRTLFRGSDAVLANSGHEPFGLVGLETMAAGGVACTGCSGEDYAVPGQNALVLETSHPSEFIGLFKRLRARPAEARALRRAGKSTARRYSWGEVVERVLLPRVEHASEDHESEFPRPRVRRAEPAGERTPGSIPPSVAMVAPLITSAWPEQRKATVLPASSGSLARRDGTFAE